MQMLDSEESSTSLETACPNCKTWPRPTLPILISPPRVDGLLLCGQARSVVCGTSDHGLLLGFKSRVLGLSRVGPKASTANSDTYIHGADVKGERRGKRKEDGPLLSCSTSHVQPSRASAASLEPSFFFSLHPRIIGLTSNFLLGSSYLLKTSICNTSPPSQVRRSV